MTNPRVGHIHLKQKKKVESTIDGQQRCHDPNMFKPETDSESIPDSIGARK